MGPPRRKLQETAEETISPPDALQPGQMIARIVGATGKNLYNVELPSSQILLAELEPRFRSTIWLRRGGYVLVDTTTLADRDNKIEAEIVNVVRDEKRWSKAPYWPEKFVKKTVPVEDDEEESTVGKMPPSDSEED